MRYGFYFTSLVPFHFPQLTKYGRSIDSKVSKTRASKVMTGLNEEAGFSIMPSWINRGLHPWLWLMYKQTVMFADPMSSQPTDWFDDNSAITEFIVAQTMQLQIIEVLR